MFRWCAYCWTFAGERAPFEDLSSTHGICDRCVASNALADADIVERTRPIKALHDRLREIATLGRSEEVHALIREWRLLGLGNIELLVAVIQPALHLVGLAWERGEVQPAQEVRLTRFCHEVLAALSSQQRESIPVTEGPPILLLSADGNMHDLGIKMLAFALREARRDVRILPKPPPAEHLRALCELLEPSAVGISVALPTHVAYVVKVADALAALPRALPIVVGGGALSQVETLPPGVVRWSAPESLLGAGAFFAAVERAT